MTDESRLSRRDLMMALEAEAMRHGWTATVMTNAARLLREQEATVGADQIDGVAELAAELNDDAQTFETTGDPQMSEYAKGLAERLRHLREVSS